MKERVKKKGSGKHGRGPGEKSVCRKCEENMRLTVLPPRMLSYHVHVDKAWEEQK